jgi:hypothetical protein
MHRNVHQPRSGPLNGFQLHAKVEHNQQDVDFTTCTKSSTSKICKGYNQSNQDVAVKAAASKFTVSKVKLNKAQEAAVQAENKVKASEDNIED